MIDPNVKAIEALATPAEPPQRGLTQAEMLELIARQAREIYRLCDELARLRSPEVCHE